MLSFSSCAVCICLVVSLFQELSAHLIKREAEPQVFRTHAYETKRVISWMAIFCWGRHIRHWPTSFCDEIIKIQSTTDKTRSKSSSHETWIFSKLAYPYSPTVSPSFPTTPRPSQSPTTSRPSNYPTTSPPNHSTMPWLVSIVLLYYWVPWHYFLLLSW